MSIPIEPEKVRVSAAKRIGIRVREKNRTRHAHKDCKRCNSVLDSEDVYLTFHRHDIFTMSHDVLSSTIRTASEVLDSVLTYLRPYQGWASGAGVACVAIWTLLQWLRTSRRQLRTTQLRGPPSKSFLYGVGKRILDADDSGSLYEAWAQEYGPVYAVPSTLGSERVVLCDPKAIAHFYSRETWTYIQTPFTKRNLAASVRVY